MREDWMVRLLMDVMSSDIREDNELAEQLGLRWEDLGGEA